jgi:hypothetical protein
MVLTCPSCESHSVRRSRRRSILGFVQRWRGLRRYRCRECRRVFYSQLSPGEQATSQRRATRFRERRKQQSDPEKRGRMRRHATELMLFFCLIVIFYAALKYLAHVR